MATTTYAQPKITKGPASLIFFYFGDSKFTTLCQETVRLKKAMEGYDRKILLKHNAVPGWLDFSEKDEKLADQIEAPTAANLKQCLAELANDGHMIDLYIFSHGWPGHFRVSTGSHGSADSFTTTDIRALPGIARLAQLPIRMVYQINCYGQTLNPVWREVGAKVTGGVKHVEFYPNRFGNFVDDWNRGNVSFDEAVQGADSDAVRTLAQTYISLVHAPSVRKEWGGCPFGKTVLGDHECAKDYFTDQWIAKDEWENGKSGKENMNQSSFMFRGGDKTLTKRDVPVWR